MNIKSRNLNLEQIAESGQCFRMNKINSNGYSVIAFGEYVELFQTDSNTITLEHASGKDFALWERYFDLEYDYSDVVAKLVQGEDDFLKRAAAFGAGLRILRQDAFEILISFIISQNKNIPAIKSTIEKLCRRYGEEKPLPKGSNDSGSTYFTFPCPERLASAGMEALKDLGLGYRDEYVHEAAKAVAEGKLDLEQLKEVDTESLLKCLMSLKGVGKKVASCVALFGYHKMNIAPIDVWISRIEKDVYKGKFDWNKYDGIAGLVQQYMFYYIRNCGKL